MLDTYSIFSHFWQVDRMCFWIFFRTRKKTTESAIYVDTQYITFNLFQTPYLQYLDNKRTNQQHVGVSFTSDVPTRNYKSFFFWLWHLNELETSFYAIFFLNVYVNLLTPSASCRSIAGCDDSSTGLLDGIPQSADDSGVHKAQSLPSVHISCLLSPVACPASEEAWWKMATKIVQLEKNEKF